MQRAEMMRDLLSRQTEKTFVGRHKELAALAKSLEESLPPVTFVHGIGGVGKSRLLEAFAGQARARSAFVVRLDCRHFEPTAVGFLRELGSAIGGDATSVQEADQRLNQISQRVILILDNYEVLRLLDTWLRQEFVPTLPTNVHLILCGREAPLAAWLCTQGWGGLFRSLSIEPLPETEAIELLELSGIPEIRARHINRFTRGHPLALVLAASTLSEPKLTVPEDLALHRLIEELARTYLLEISDKVARVALEAISVVRCATISLLRAMLPEAAPQDVYERLREIPFVQIQRGGLQIHDSLQQAIALGVKAADPGRYLKYRRAAWYQLRTEVRNAPISELWRYTADMLYLLENPIVREAFFPTNAHVYAVEPARAEDANSIFEIIRQWDGPEAARCLELWWKHAAKSFSVARDSSGNVSGFYCMFDAGSITSEVSDGDPIVRNWVEHLQTVSASANEKALFCRAWLTREAGEGPCAAQGACWLDIKRAYMSLRPQLRRVYFAVRPPAFTAYGTALGQLGFQVIPSADVTQDGELYRTGMLDFGPSSVDGWLAGLVAAELGVIDFKILDVEARELVLDGRRIPLTRLEFEVMRYLHEHEGSSVGRESLLRDVWGNQYDVGSNVVDVVVRSLRKKLDKHANLIETVSGFGYRFRSPVMQESAGEPG
jgi:hypothetical protein